MKFYLVIPVHNEEAFLKQTLQSLVEQTVLPKKIVIVNDNSTDGSQEIIDSFCAQYEFIASVVSISEGIHTPGSKIINAFYNGIETLDDDFDVICKFDADLVFPKNYLATIQQLFEVNSNCGMAGGFCYIEKNNGWVLENLTGKDHLRGALKAYRKNCFKQIGGLRSAMGWDTVDELLARYNGWEVCTEATLQVKHLKPTGVSYSRASKFKQGEAFYRMRYGLVLTKIASLKLAFYKKSVPFYVYCIIGFISAWLKRTPYIVSKSEGIFIRKYRWKNILDKFRL